ncbi:hypothetical protein V5799_025396 [Amblyomma americanum]|uniref:Uncharacterized protein n=1 Tax=Amblyomma americanum TaxID=6943 RepID=A0AAQ4E9H3_AMBAM
MEYPSPLTESAPASGSSVRRRGLSRGRRTLFDDENVYEVQAQWKARGWFELRERNEASGASLSTLLAPSNAAPGGHVYAPFCPRGQWFPSF